MTMDDAGRLPEIELPYHAVHEVEMGPHGPVGGVADFHDVRCRFRANESSRWRKHARGILCDLIPIDEAHGLPLIVDASFRQRDGALEVHWNPFDCPGLDPRDPAMPLRFAEFLERLAAGTATAVHWFPFIIEHYPDEHLEETRRKCVRILYHADDRLKAARESPCRERLLALAADLRARHEPPNGQPAFPPGTE